MSGIDVREIKLELRYPDSRQEDVTDAFMRGYTGAIEVSNRAIEKLQTENERLRELVRHIGACIQHLDRSDEDGGCVRCPYQLVEHDCGFERRMRELGVEVDE